MVSRRQGTSRYPPVGFFDRPSVWFEPTVRFWSAITASSLSPPRGDDDQSATLIPPDGEPCLPHQRVRAGPSGSHLDDLGACTRRTVAAGAQAAPVQRRRRAAVALRPVVVRVGHNGEPDHPAPQSVDRRAVCTSSTRSASTCPPRCDEECAFWSPVTDWEQRQSSLRPEFRSLARPEGCPYACCSGDATRTTGVSQPAAAPTFRA